ncbi:MAG: type II toxin-antitoxin system VapC family toxin [Tomitella sp.]|nr:type II toxin-antitoxin system VapC family toxin [Tomitella sp.]
MDTSAMTKLIAREAETSALIGWLGDHPDEPVVTSALGRVELMRTAVRDGIPGMPERARDLLDGFDTLPITERVIVLAETLGPPNLRPLDAIHLASASQIGPELTAFVAYDHRLLDGCRAVGYPTASPST